MSQVLRRAQVALAKRGTWVKKLAHILLAYTIHTLEYVRSFSMTPEVNLMNLLMLLGRWEKGTTDIAKQKIKPGSTIVDIGAHVGYYTRLFAHAAGSTGKVYAFEPHPDNRALLMKNTAHLPTVSVSPCAVSTAPGTLVLFESAVGSGSHSLVESRYPHMREINVETVSIDTFFTDKNIAVDFMKIDVEGAEHEVLDGGQRMFRGAQAPDMLIEFSPPIISGRGLAPASLITKLQDFGYHIFVIDEEHNSLIPLSTWENVDTFVQSVHKVANLFVTKNNERLGTSYK